MNSIQSNHYQQLGQINKSGALRNAAKSYDLPALTKDESSLIEEKFSPDESLNLYSVDGSVQRTQLSRGANIDTRI